MVANDSDNSVLPKIAAMRGYFGSTHVGGNRRESKQPQGCERKTNLHNQKPFDYEKDKDPTRSSRRVWTLSKHFVPSAKRIGHRDKWQVINAGSSCKNIPSSRFSCGHVRSRNGRMAKRNLTSRFKCDTF